MEKRKERGKKERDRKRLKIEEYYDVYEAEKEPGKDPKNGRKVSKERARKRETFLRPRRNHFDEIKLISQAIFSPFSFQPSSESFLKKSGPRKHFLFLYFLSYGWRDKGDV